MHGLGAQHAHGTYNGCSKLVVSCDGVERLQTAYCMQARNVHKMELVEGHGNEFVSGRAREGDAINRVYVLDSDELPFNQAEVAPLLCVGS